MRYAALSMNQARPLVIHNEGFSFACIVRQGAARLDLSLVLNWLVTLHGIGRHRGQYSDA